VGCVAVAAAWAEHTLSVPASIKRTHFLMNLFIFHLFTFSFVYSVVVYLKACPVADILYTVNKLYTILYIIYYIIYHISHHIMYYIIYRE
jgi:hypothetical protein